MDAVSVVPTEPQYFEELVALDSLIFDGLPDSEAFTAAMYASHVAHFPEGQLTALVMQDSRWVVAGSTTTMRTNSTFDDDTYGYYFDFIGRGTLSTHDPAGQWLYGIVVSVHPDFRRLGIGSRLYQARRALVSRLHLRGELVAGLLPGYASHRDRLSVEAYVEQVVAGRLTDPTLSMQLRNGFRVTRLLRGYVRDARSDDTVTLLVRENSWDVSGGT
ncbi:MAG: GNAT family N-acetyltransferase [Chloroflexi bacterium]|nr:GNAT family N-acetyltransferase [Chloroflexota bacterium]